MPQIIKIIEIAKKGSNRVIRLSDGREILLCREVIEKYQLKKGAELSLSELHNINIDSDLIRAGNYVSYLLARREYSIGMIAAKMKMKNFPADIITKTIDRLIDAGFLDDVRFATNAAESILRNKPAGRRYLIAYLRSRYISGSLAETVVDKLLEKADQNELAVRLLRPRLRSYAKLDLETARRKAYNYLSRRAIGYGAAKFAFEKLINELKEEPDD